MNEVVVFHLFCLKILCCFCFTFFCSVLLIKLYGQPVQKISNIYRRHRVHLQEQREFVVLAAVLVDIVVVVFGGYFAFRILLS